jgi:hypothetical protein
MAHVKLFLGFQSLPDSELWLGKELAPAQGAAKLRLMRNANNGYDQVASTFDRNNQHQSNSRSGAKTLAPERRRLSASTLWHDCQAYPTWKTITDGTLGMK